MTTYRIAHVTDGPLEPHFKVVIEGDGDPRSVDACFRTQDDAQAAIRVLKREAANEDAP